MWIVGVKRRSFRLNDLLRRRFGTRSRVPPFQTNDRDQEAPKTPIFLLVCCASLANFFFTSFVSEASQVGYLIEAATASNAPNNMEQFV